MNVDDVPQPLGPGDGDPVLAHGPFVVVLEAGRAIGMRLAFEVEQEGHSIRWDDPGEAGRAHFLGDVDWVPIGNTLASGVANGGTSVLIRGLEPRDLDGTPYEGLSVDEAVRQLREDNPWA